MGQKEAFTVQSVCDREQEKSKRGTMNDLSPNPRPEQPAKQGRESPARKKAANVIEPPPHARIPPCYQANPHPDVSHNHHHPSPISTPVVQYQNPSMSDDCTGGGNINPLFRVVFSILEKKRARSNQRKIPNGEKEHQNTNQDN
ncbi:hypothetical protein VTL71DRAFT_15465 [Oculimacula yallundae]|uniref:Uncharacterized protein n=1 Tax=Oculimacula yallundae TaxID=86028 RepID=A0ABR4CGN3_9HELO